MAACVYIALAVVYSCMHGKLHLVIYIELLPIPQYIIKLAVYITVLGWAYFKISKATVRPKRILLINGKRKNYKIMKQCKYLPYAVMDPLVYSPCTCTHACMYALLPSIVAMTFVMI